MHCSGFSFCCLLRCNEGLTALYLYAVVKHINAQLSLLVIAIWTPAFRSPSEACVCDSAGSSSVHSTSHHIDKLRHAYSPAQDTCGRLVQLTDTNAARAAQTVAVYS